MTPTLFGPLFRASRSRGPHWRIGCRASLREPSDLKHHTFPGKGTSYFPSRKTPPTSSGRFGRQSSFRPFHYAHSGFGPPSPSPEDGLPRNCPALHGFHLCPTLRAIEALPPETKRIASRHLEQAPPKGRKRDGNCRAACGTSQFFSKTDRARARYKQGRELAGWSGGMQGGAGGAAGP